MIIPKKNHKWKDFFLYCKIPIGVDLSFLWRAKKVTDDLGQVGTLEGFDEINTPDVITTELLEDDIPQGGKAPYN